MNIWTAFFFGLSAVAVSYPFLVGSERAGELRTSKTTKEGTVEESTCKWIESEIEMDRATGKLSDEDHDSIIPDEQIIIPDRQAQEGKADGSSSG